MIALTIPMIEVYGLETEEERRCEIKQAVCDITERVLKIANQFTMSHLFCGILRETVELIEKLIQ